MAAFVARLTGLLLPARVRSFVRAREIGLVLVAVLIGAVSGVFVTAIAGVVQLMHSLLFGLDPGARLSGSQDFPQWRGVVVPVLGGLVLAGLSIMARPLAGRLADAIEANALYGGRLSFKGSLFVTLQTVVSSGFGASVGLEAGYAQICAAVSSRLGSGLAARRADMRLLVACGAAGAIAGAFNAPLAGAFYGFEVALGTYTVGALAPVAASALVASLITREFSESTYLIKPGSLSVIAPSDLAHIVAIAAICALFGTLVMRAVGASELAFKTLKVPPRLRPALGGLLIGGMSLVTPQVLGSGHGALTIDLIASMTPFAIITVLVLKSLASAISLGSGFRGGLFYASLLLGALTGRLYVDLGWRLDPDIGLDPDLAALTGMAAFGTGVIGAPVTMTALALETTGSFAITIAALIAATIASVIVRETFGYSFATWRFHLRGEAIRGPHDVGWMRELSVKKLMREDVRTLPQDATIADARRKFPLGTLKNFVAVDEADRYAGLVTLDDLYMTGDDGAGPVSTLIKQKDKLLMPWMTVREALDIFEAAESDALIVVDNATARRVLGMLSESHALRSYGRELENQNPDNVMLANSLSGKAGAV